MSNAEPAWMEDIRGRAREQFESLPWPTTSQEEWRRTDLAPYDLGSYGSSGPKPDACYGESEPAGVAGQLRFEAGGCVDSALASALRERGVRLLSLGAAVESLETPLKGLFEESLGKIDDRFAAWQLAEWQTGAFLYVPDGVEVAEPFLIELEAAGTGLAAPRIVVILGTGARATVVERIVGTDTGRDGILCNAALDLHLGDASNLLYCEAQELDAKSLYFRRAWAELGRDTTLRHFTAQLGGRLVKTKIDCALAGQGSDARLDGAYFCSGGQHVDIRTVQRHLSPKGTSRANYRGAIDSGGNAVFQGLIEVGEGASGTDAYLASKSLILGDGARADSLPTLKIGNNDVRCSHGSTTGRLSDEELFYLESRGFSPEDAREMLVIGYFEDLLGSTPTSYGAPALERIRHRLHRAA